MRLWSLKRPNVGVKTAELVAADGSRSGVQNGVNHTLQVVVSDHVENTNRSGMHYLVVELGQLVQGLGSLSVSADLDELHAHRVGVVRRRDAQGSDDFLDHLTQLMRGIVV
jgi:hypothetical protein